jgi:hypothetical protein
VLGSEKLVDGHFLGMGGGPAMAFQLAVGANQKQIGDKKWEFIVFLP